MAWGPKLRTVADLESLAVRNEATGCLRMRKADPYARITFEGRGRYAHHVAWELEHGAPPVIGWQPDGEYWVVAHKCDVKACIEPSHLENVPQSKNVTDSYRRGLKDVEEHSQALRRAWARRKAA